MEISKPTPPSQDHVYDTSWELPPNIPLQPTLALPPNPNVVPTLPIQPLFQTSLPFIQPIPLHIFLPYMNTFIMTYVKIHLFKFSLLFQVHLRYLPHLVVILGLQKGKLPNL